jgi:hypothetical protein
LEESTMRAQVIAATELKPLRLNFAQVCIQCGERWCESPLCVAKHERSRWIVCRACDGFMETTDGLGCSCLFGLEETYPAGGSRLPARTAMAPPGRPAAPADRATPCVPGALGSLAFDPEYAEYVAYKAGRRS